MRAELQRVDVPRDPGIRTPTRGDVQELAELMLNAYAGSIDDEGEGPAECLIEIEKTYNGEYGAFIADCSRVWEQGGRIVSAVLVTRWENRPFIAFTMTERASMRQGLARKCLLSAMSALYQRGERELRLRATLANAPAVLLYQSLGFVVQDN